MYRFSNAECSLILRDSDGAAIPAMSGNRDYDDLVAARVAIEPYTPWQNLEEAKVALARAVADKAGVIILAAYPLHTQLNAAARAIELIDAKSTRALTEGEAEEEAAIRALHDTIKNIRAAAAQKQMEIAALADLAAATQCDVEAGWPQ